MANIQNNFSWSFTRHKSFEECPRQYYYNYYGYWNGWNADAPDQARLAYRLKKVQTLPMWLGSLVHEMIERILGDLRNRELNTLERYQQQARERMNREWMQSLEKKWQWKPKYNLNLFEHYYGLEITPDQRGQARDKVFTSLANFMRSDVFQRLEALRPGEWKTVEQLDQFPVHDQPVYIKIDCATCADESLTIYDWKTGRETDDTLTQLGCYALYAFQTWHVPLDRQKLVSFYLASDVVRENVPTAAEVIQTKEFIMGSMEAMIAALDSDAKKNLASEEKFAMTDNRNTCRRCPFREICFGSREALP